MKVTAIKAFYVKEGGKRITVSPGQCVEVSNAAGRAFINQGRAKAGGATEKTTPKPAKKAAKKKAAKKV